MRRYYPRESSEYSDTAKREIFPDVNTRWRNDDKLIGDHQAVLQRSFAEEDVYHEESREAKANPLSSASL